MKISKLALLASAAIVLPLGVAHAQEGRPNINIAGSSTVLPFASIVAEEFGLTFNRPTPVVNGGGSTGGLTQFCQGAGLETIDIANASRPIRPAEITTCNNNGVMQILEVMFGFDGIVFATSISQGDFALEPRDVFLALAASVPVNGEWVANPYTNWNQIDASLPNQEIVLVIPDVNHGTREVFQERVVTDGCTVVGGSGAQCTTFRQDGRVIAIAGDYTETLARLQAQPAAVGVFGLSFYEQNLDKLKVATVDGITPSLETIASGEYPVSRPLFFYVKGEHIGAIPNIDEYVRFFLSPAIAGVGGLLEEAGLVPAPAETLEAELASYLAREYTVPAAM